MNKFWISVCMVFCLNSAFSTVIAGSKQENKTVHAHSDIILTAEHFIAATVNKKGESSLSDSTVISVKPLDKRLKLHKCSLPLEAFWPPGAVQVGHTSVGIRCSDYKPWKIYLGAQIKLFEEVWVSKAAISRGTILTKEHITLEKREISFAFSEYFSKQQNPLGLKAKRPLRQGDILKVLTLEKPMAIKRGDRVVVIARINGLEIRTSGTALSSAAEGDRIRVRNISSDKELEGILSKNSVVHVNI